MTRTLEVRLADRRVGTISNLSGDYNVFRFDDEYVDDQDRPVLSQGYIDANGTPLTAVRRTHRIAPPFFANLLPEEDTQLRRIIARQHGINRTRDFPFLQVAGLDLPGAVVVHDPEAVLIAEREEPNHGAEERSTDALRFSLAGIQLKFSAGVTADRVSVPAQGVGGSWIVKLPTNAYPRLPENEFTVMRLAAAIGLDVPRTELFPLDAVEGLPSDLPALRHDEPRLVYAISRFDRAARGTRIHAEDFNQIAGQAPAEKYENKPMHWIAHVVATLCPDDVDELVRRLVFGVCTGNNDMHLKNWAVVYPDERNARLAPMYDYVCTRLYFPAGALALSIGGETAFERVGRETLRSFAARAELPVKRTLKLADETITALRDMWPSFRETVPDPDLTAALEREFTISPLMNAR